MRIACLNAVFRGASRMARPKGCPREVEVTVQWLTLSARNGVVKQYLHRQPENTGASSRQASRMSPSTHGLAGEFPRLTPFRRISKRRKTDSLAKERQMTMEYRQLGGSGFKVPVLSFGTGTFGGSNEFFKAWGASDVAEATRLVDICLDAGLTMFDSADIYSDGMAEEILGQRSRAAATRCSSPPRATFRAGDRPQRRRLVALSPDPRRRRRACGGSAPITSTSTSCTASTP